MQYNMTAITANNTGILSFVRGVNEILVDGHLFHVFLIALFIIILSSAYLKSGEFRSSLMGTMFLIMVLTLTFIALDLVSPIAFFICLVGTMVSVAMSFGS